jgi:phosphoribosylanthranilate isomerase
VLLMEGPIKPINTALRRIKPYAVQLIGPYTPEDIKSIKEETGVKIWKPVRVPRSDDGIKHDFERQLAELQHAAIDAIVLDTLVPGHKGGTGQTCDWNTAARIVHSASLPVFLAGGLTPENVAQAVAEVKPYGVDVSSGVESSSGHKDLQKVSGFIQQANESQRP